MITLDGNTYECYQTKYGHEQKKFASTTRGVTGSVLRVETGVFQNEYHLTLLCQTTEIATLRTSFAKVTATGTPPSNLLAFTDEEGLSWEPGTGSDDSTHKYSTGVYFIEMGEPTPLTQKGWVAGNYFTVPVTLLVNDSDL